MSTIISRRARIIKARAELAKHLEEKYMSSHVPLSIDEKNRVQRVFDDIRRQLRATQRA